VANTIKPVFYGWQKDPYDSRDYTHLLRVGAGGLPDFFVLDCLPSVRNQGSLGSCSGFGIGGMLTGVAKQLNVYKEWFSPTWIYNGGRLYGGTLKWDSGAFPRNCYEFLRDNGTLLEHFRPYVDVLDKTDPTTWVCAREAKNYPILNYFRITEGIAGICSALADGHLISLGSPWYESWLDVPPTGRLPEKYKSIVGGHATFLYGYNLKKKVVFGQNSWGTSWGNEGRFLMPFSAFDAFKETSGYDAHYVVVSWGSDSEKKTNTCLGKIIDFFKGIVRK